MAEWLNISTESVSEDDGINHENEVFQFEHASYLTEFDDGYDPEEDPEFEDPTGLDGFEFDTMKLITSNGDDIEEEFEEGDAFDDTRVCFKTGRIPPGNTWSSWANLVSLGPCKHMCCIVWHLKPIHAKDQYDSPTDTFLKHHSELYVGCTDKKCKDPNATGILFKAILLARASKIFNPRTAAKLKSTAKSFKISAQRTAV